MYWAAHILYRRIARLHQFDYIRAHIQYSRIPGCGTAHRLVIFHVSIHDVNGMNLAFWGISDYAFISYLGLYSSTSVYCTHTRLV